MFRSPPPIAQLLYVISQRAHALKCTKVPTGHLHQHGTHVVCVVPQLQQTSVLPQQYSLALNQMQKLRQQATEQSGVPYSAVEEARAANLYDKLGWDRICALSQAFYSSVYNDEEWFRRIFANTTREAAMRNQREFLAQEFGGPPLYKERKGHTAILGRHGPYAVDGRAAKRWLEHMDAAVHSVVEEEELQVVMMKYFRHMAWYIVFGKQLVNGMRTVGYYGKHSEGQV